MALYDRSFTGNRVVALAQKLVFETTQYLIWGKWMKFNTPDKSAVNPNKILLPLINSPIIVHRELERKQGDTLEVPMLRALLNLPKYGTDQMAGHEERGKINNAKIFIDIIRHAFEDQDGIMMRQTTKDIDLAKQARPLLQNHYARAEALTQCSMAFYKGFSDNIISSNRFSQSQVSHPHVFIAGQGKVSYGTYGYPGNTAYEQGIVTESDLMGAGDVFDTQFLTGLRADDDIRKIPYLLGANGTEYRIIVAHHWQLADLVADPNFNAKAAAALSGVMAKENPYLVGCKYFWEDFAIFDGGNCIFPFSKSGSDPVWGPASFDSLDDFNSFAGGSYDKFGAIILGDNAMAKATGTPMEFRRREDDFGEVHGIAYRIVEGFARPDYKNLDDGTTGQYWKNDSSAIAITMATQPTM